MIRDADPTSPFLLNSTPFGFGAGDRHDRVFYNKTSGIQVSPMILSALGGLGENPLNRWKSVDGCMDPSSEEGGGGDPGFFQLPDLP